MNTIVKNSCRSIFVQVATFFARYGLNYRDLQQILKEAVVEAAIELEKRSNDKVSSASVAARVGLSRKVVAQLRRDTLGTKLQTESSLPAGMVLREWHQNPLYCDNNGSPATLRLESDSRAPDFKKLVESSGDTRSAEVVLDELCESGAVERVDEATVRVLSRAFIMHASDESVVRYFGIAGSNLLATLNHNTDSNSQDKPYFERTTWVSEVLPGTFGRFSDLVSEMSVPFVDILDDWLTSRKATDGQSSDNDGKDGVVGLGIYVFDRKKD